MSRPYLTSQNQLSALIITFNEEANLYRTLSSLTWISDILIIDSGSTDKTLDIISNFSNARVIHRAFDTFANQCNYGIGCLSSEWILSLDADYVLSQQLSNEIINLISKDSNNKHLAGFQIGFKYCVNGKPIRSGLLPPRTCIYRRSLAMYIDNGHSHHVVINGKTGATKNKIYHDDRKPIAVWLATQSKYQRIEAEMLTIANSSKLPLQDLIRKHTCLAPFSAVFMCLFLRGGILDGKEGIIYAFQRLIAESLLYIYMHSRLSNDS